MKIEDGMLLYHGSYSYVEQIDLNRCASGKDFGKGFYLTESFDQAKGFIRTSLKKARNTNIIPQDRDYGFVSVFRYHAPEEPVTVFQFDTAGKEWLWFVSMNRRSNMANRFRSRLSEELLSAEIIIGKIANDTTNPTIMAYLNGLYGDVESDTAVNFAIRQLLPDRLKSQFCFLSEQAVTCLEFVEAIRYEQ